MTYYVYRHIRVDTGEPFYIGVGTKPSSFSSWKAEYRRAYQRSTKTRSKWWLAVTRKVSYEVEILVEVDTKEEAYSKEIEFITLYGRRDIGTGKLANLTPGGLNLPPETKRKMASALSRPVIDTSTGTVYKSVKDAAVALDKNTESLRRILRQHSYRTLLRYVTPRVTRYTITRDLVHEEQRNRK